MRNGKAETIRLDECWNRIGVWGDKQCPELAHTPHCRNCETYSQASRRLLDRKPPAGYLQSWTKLLANSEKEIVVGKLSVLVFRIGSEWFGLATSLFNEVSEERCVHSIPHRSNRFLLGIVNMRGEIHLCISLGALLGIDVEEATAGDKARKRMLLTAAINELPMAFEVDEISGVQSYHPDELRAVPATLPKEASACSTGLLRLEKRHIAILDSRMLAENISRSLS